MSVVGTAVPTPGDPEHRLWNRNFALLWQGQLVSQLGNQAFAIAMMYWLMESTGSASLMGAIMMASTLPGVLLGPVGGTIADRHPRIRLIVGADLVRGVVTLALFATMALRPDADGLIVGMLFATAIVGGIAGAVFMPAISAAIPDLVPRSRLAAANSLNQFSVQAVSFVGQAIGGVLYRVLGAPLLILIDGVSFLLSALSEAFIRLPAGDRAKGRPEDWSAPGDADATATAPGSFRTAFAAYKHDTIAGIRYVWGNAGMRSFLLLTMNVNFLVMPVIVLLPFHVSLRLAAGPEWYGFLLAMLGVGSILGYTIAGAVPISARRRATVLVAAFFLLGAAFVGLGQARAPLAALAAFAAIGLGSGLINIFVVTLLQTATPPDMRGRVMALVVTLSMSATPIGMALGGVVGDLTDKNTPLVFGACGVLMTLATLLLTRRRSLREFLSTEVSG